MFVQRHVHLARAEDHPLDLFRGRNVASGVFGIGNYPLEMRVTNELLDWGAGEGMTEKRFGEEHDEGWES